MLAFEEQVSQDPGRSLRCFADHRSQLPLQYHQHAAYELTMVAGRGCRRLVGDREEACEPVDLVLLGSHLPHGWQGVHADGYRCLVVQFDATLVAGGLASLPEAAGILRLLDESSAGLHAPQGKHEGIIARLWELPAASGMAQLLAFMSVLEALARSSSLRRLRPAFRPRAGDARQAAVCDWLQRHCHHPIDLARLASQFDMRASAFSQWFRRRCGCSLSEYLQQLRIGRACERLLTSDAPVAEIALACGFRNLSNFNRLFRRRCGCSPRAYRRRSLRS